MGTQVKLPGTLPTPAQARGKLKDARAERRTVLGAVLGFKAEIKAIGKELMALEGELEDAERTMENAVEDSPEQLEAEKDQGATWDALCALEKKEANVKGALAKGEARLAECNRILREAREDIKAIRQGRRVR